MDSWDAWLEKEAATGPTEHLNPRDADEKVLVQQVLENESIYVGRKLTTNISVPGNPHKAQFRDFWRNEICPSTLVMDTIEFGYKLPFAQIPPASFEKNNKSAREDMDFVRAEVLRLESLKCLSKVTERPHLILPLSSVFSKKKRLVVDASRALNPHLQHRRVRLQDHRDVPNVVKQGDFLACDDLDSGYWHVMVHPEHRKFLGIHIFGEDGNPIFFVWNVLFLGVSDAVFIFSALLKPVRSYIASLGITCLFYLDDILTLGRSEEDCRRNRDLVVDVLAKTGWVVSHQKATGPASRLKFLGLEICSTEMSFFIPDMKLTRLLDMLESLLSARRVKLRFMASFLGFLQSCARALGPVVRLMSRISYNWLMQRVNSASYEAHFPLSDEVNGELTFWQNQVHLLNGRQFSPVLSLEAETRMVVVTDSSASGCFGFQIQDKYKILLRRSFSTAEMAESSTMRELLALKYIYSGEEGAQFAGKKVLHLTDNQAVTSIMEVGSSKPKIQKVVLEIFLRCRDLNIDISTEWRPRDNALLQHADLGSKSFDENSVSLDFSSFSALLEFFPEVPIDVDGFAQSYNKKAEIFFSKQSEPEAAGLNFFSQKLSPSLSYYCFPPPGVLLATILHLAMFQARGLLVLPIWTSASFWPNFAPDGIHLPIWAQRFLRFRANFVCDPEIRSTTFKNPVKFDTLVIKFDFTVARENELFLPSFSLSNCLNYGCVNCVF